MTRAGAAVMTSAAQPASPAPRTASLENAALTLVFGAAVVLPLVEIALRKFAGTGIQGVATLVQHLTLALGMLGAMVAARDERLLALAVISLYRGRGAVLARFASGALSAAVAGMLALAAAEFVAIERASASTLTYAIPVWIAQLPLPLGFGVVALRLAWHASTSAGGRAAAALIATGAVALVHASVIEPSQMLTPALVLLLIATALGAPIFVTLGGAALFLLLSQGVPAASVAVNHYALVINPSLPAIPMFTLAGYLLAESGAPRRLVELFDALFGRYRGGAAIVTVLACTFFSCFTGASGVTILALGGLVVPLLANAGYAERKALGLVTAAGLPGVLLAPALPLILYAIVARVSIEDMFLGGALPALLMAGITIAWAIWRQPRVSTAPKPFDSARALRAIKAAKWELSLPVVPIGALASGLATPVEAAAATAFYAFVVSALIHRDLGVRRDLPRVVAECGLMVGGILLILGVALGLTNYLVDAQIPEYMVAWVTSVIQSPLVFLLALNALLLAAGCLMDIYTAIVVLAPLLVPIGVAFGVHPVHLGIVFLANLEIGYLTPPVGMNLFFASYRFGRPVTEIFRAVAPLLVALGAALLLITYVPWLSTLLPGLRG
jgi:tripartite ATP-independent transporter DctM subunit